MIFPAELNQTELWGFWPPYMSLSFGNGKIKDRHNSLDMDELQESHSVDLLFMAAEDWEYFS